MNRPVDTMINQSVLGRYRIVQKLAHGGMGTVYLGRTEGAAGFAKPVVIKRVLPTLVDDKEVSKMFVREARILSNLEHPNIVSVLDFGQQDDGAYVMVLEYAHGFQLAEWQRFVNRERGLLDVDFALHIASKVLEALHYAHTFKRSDGLEMRIIHRDVSPSNVVLTEQGAVKLLDFGIARVTGDQAEFKTQRPRVKGKLPYLALEMFKGDDPTPQSDVYSAAVMLYEMLTGQNPFVGRDTADIYFKILNTVPQSVHAVRDDAPERIDDVLFRALSKKPEERYSSAGEFAGALRALRSDSEEVVARRLAEQLRADYTGTMPEMLGLERLSVREEAWRTGEARATQPMSVSELMDEDTDVTGPMDSVGPGDHGAVTVQGDVESDAAAPAPAASVTQPAPELRQKPASGAAAGLGRAGVVASALLLLGVIVAGGFWVLTQRAGSQQVVVIERQSTPTTPSAPAAEPDEPDEPAAQAGAEAPDESEPAAADEPPDQEPEAANPDPAPAAQAESGPAPPDPRRLTRRFSRRQNHIEACFARHAKGLEGSPRLSVYFTIGTDGRVDSAKLSPAALSGTPLGKCILNVAQETRFGPQQREVSFSIPITARTVE
ncbi:MAG: protein kinase [Myxococcales bacterium]|nr:protein kinase [Myxococcales bacterium]